MPLQIYYDQEEPNSVPNWMERWSISCFWKLPPQPKRTTASKSQAKRGSYAMETESGRPKRNVRKNSPVTVDVGPTKTTSEPDKPKRNVKKFLSSTDSVQDPQSELEKVKRNLRKVSGSLPETSDGPEIATDAQPRSIRKVVDPLSENPEQGAHESQGRTKKYIALTTEVKPDMEIEGTADQLVDNSLPNADKDGNVSVMNGELNVKEEQTCTEMNGELNVKEEQTCTEMNGELNVKEEQTCTENQKTSKRRASFSAKSDYAENGLQNTPSLPSYMQATKSAKAKLRGLNSARFGSDSAEKNEPTRRHSLPSSVNGKVNSYSPRTQKILQTSGKGGGCRSDRSLLSSRDGNEKLIHVGWRR